MGRQINVIMDLMTEKEFVKAVHQDGSILSQMTKPLSAVVDLPEPFSGPFWAKMFLYQEQFGGLAVRELPDGFLSVDSKFSPVIDFIRTVVHHEENTVRGGRLWIEMNYWNEHGELVEKPKELLAWYNKPTSWIKKNLEIEKIHGSNYYITTEMKRFIEESGYKRFT